MLLIVSLFDCDVGSLAVLSALWLAVYNNLDKQLQHRPDTIAEKTKHHSQNLKKKNLSPTDFLL